VFRPLLSHVQWAAVCAAGFDPVDAGVVCKQLGLGTLGTPVAGASYGTPPGRIWLDQVYCSGTEERLEDCASRGWGVIACSSDNIVGIVCGKLVGANRLVPSLAKRRAHMSCLTSLSVVLSADADKTIRLVPGPNAGRLEILHAGVWGTM